VDVNTSSASKISAARVVAKTTVNHFYEKLLLLKDRMNTESARVVAESRHEVLENFLGEFLREWDARDVDIPAPGPSEFRA
jgi:HD superfamily phosphodiesterase